MRGFDVAYRIGPKQTALPSFQVSVSEHVRLMIGFDLLPDSECSLQLLYKPRISLLFASAIYPQRGEETRIGGICQDRSATPLRRTPDLQTLSIHHGKEFWKSIPHHYHRNIWSIGSEQSKIPGGFESIRKHASIIDYSSVRFFLLLHEIKPPRQFFTPVRTHVSTLRCERIRESWLTCGFW